MKCFPSGRNRGNRWLLSPFSNRDTATGSPPEADTLKIGDAPVGVNKMMPSAFHDPPRPPAAFANVCGAPPAISARFSFESAKNPTDVLSGDQNGYDAPSVPTSGCAVSES